MITNSYVPEIAKWLGGDSNSKSTYIELGTGTTEATRDDTDTETGLLRKAITFSTEDVVLQERSEILSTESTLYGEDITETGAFTASTDGTLMDHYVTSNVIGFDATTQLRITRFKALDNTRSQPRTWFLDDGMNEILLMLSNGTNAAPTHVAWSSDIIIEQCDAIGVGPNDWTEGASAATTPTLNTANIREGVSAVNMGKDGAASTSFYYTKALAATVDVSDVTQFKLDYDIYSTADLAKFDSTSALQLRIGSDSSNYKHYTFARSELLVGWQTLVVTTSDMTTQGSPNMAAVDYVAIYMTTNNATDVITHGELIMDYWRGYYPLSVTDTTMHDEQLRNALSTTEIINNLVRIRAIAAKADGNTYNYRFVGLFNASSGGDFFLSALTYDERKSASVQITAIMELQLGIYGV